MIHRFKSLAEWSAFLERDVLTRQMPKTINSVLQMVGEESQREIQGSIIGRVSPLGAVGPFSAWPPLKPATIEQKANKGQGKGGDPRTILFAEGDLHDSISFKVNRGMRKVAVGSNDPVAAYQEYGTSHIPPRPFVGPGMFRTISRLYPHMETILCRTLSGDRPFR